MLRLFRDTVFLRGRFFYWPWCWGKSAADSRVGAVSFWLLPWHAHKFSLLSAANRLYLHYPTHLYSLLRQHRIEIRKATSSSLHRHSHLIGNGWWCSGSSNSGLLKPQKLTPFGVGKFQTLNVFASSPDDRTYVSCVYSFHPLKDRRSLSALNIVTRCMGFFAQFFSTSFESGRDLIIIVGRDL